jgi:hypothetical protein
MIRLTTTALIVLASTASTMPTPIAMRIQRRFGALDSSSRPTAIEGRGLVGERGFSATEEAEEAPVALRGSRTDAGAGTGAGAAGVVRGASKNVIGSGATEVIGVGGS